MKNSQIIASCVASYLFGIAVSTYADRKQLKSLNKENELLLLNNQALAWYVRDGRFLSYEEQCKLIEEKINFIKIAQRIK